jgi:cell division protein FtsB
MISTEVFIGAITALGGLVAIVLTALGKYSKSKVADRIALLEAESKHQKELAEIKANEDQLNRSAETAFRENLMVQITNLTNALHAKDNDILARNAKIQELHDQNVQLLTEVKTLRQEVEHLNEVVSSLKK